MHIFSFWLWWLGFFDDEDCDTVEEIEDDIESTLFYMQFSRIIN